MEAGGLFLYVFNDDNSKGSIMNEALNYSA